ncbi:Protein phosphatase methylesterase 1 [Rasamsonia emersonii CBS 393.64]|uniref:Protein phosphatase methylesterase 1 n=1 Tax=Rasamsonia emersonii (strain ATCC 16479 / CBS 393.64 / IMI 116815) TaxID=1408163 RepID=A0A0F4Z442_RASE3|nr:Protein phosphatase methylesterase 1 [Rasamsonia emersonii CBS 393.64]KKA24633.1 Protein phosphatase methylesterase 1 [Rasamsonia emersonii CBS 393.64]
MSDFQKEFVKSRLAKLPPEAPPLLDDADDTAAPHHDDDSSSASSASSTGTVVPSPGKNLFARPSGLSPRQRPSSLSWTDFYARELFLEEDVGDLHIVHHAYITPPTGSGPLFVMHHGAGSSGLSFASCSGEIRKLLPEAGILSVDARYHGSTTVSGAKGHEDEKIEPDFRLETLSRDLLFVIDQTRSQMGWETLPDLVLANGCNLRIGDGRTSEYGQLPLYATEELSVVEFRNRMAHPLSNNPQYHVSTGLCALIAPRRREPRRPIAAVGVEDEFGGYEAILGGMVRGTEQEVSRSQRRKAPAAGWDGPAGQGADDWADAGKVSTPGDPRRGTLHPRRPTQQDGSDPGGLLQAKRPQRARPAAKVYNSKLFKKFSSKAGLMVRQRGP